MKERFTRYSAWTKLQTNTNLEDQAFQNAHVGSIDVSASGGNEKTRYYISGSYYNRDDEEFYSSRTLNGQAMVTILPNQLFLLEGMQAFLC